MNSGKHLLKRFKEDTGGLRYVLYRAVPVFTSDEIRLIRASLKRIRAVLKLQGCIDLSDADPFRFLRPLFNACGHVRDPEMVIEILQLPRYRTPEQCLDFLERLAQKEAMMFSGFDFAPVFKVLDTMEERYGPKIKNLKSAEIDAFIRSSRTEILSMRDLALTDDEYLHKLRKKVKMVNTIQKALSGTGAATIPAFHIAGKIGHWHDLYVAADFLKRIEKEGNFNAKVSKQLSKTLEQINKDCLEARLQVTDYLQSLVF